MSVAEQFILCAGTIPRAGFRERVDAAARAGFSAITLFPEHYQDARGHERLSRSEIRRCLCDAGIVVQQLDPLLDWYGDAASKSELRLYEAAETTKAKSINVAPAFAPTGDLRFLADRLAALGERAAPGGLSIDLEFLPWSAIPNLGVALSVVQDCGLPNVGIMLDSWHFFRSGGSIADLTAEAVSHVTGVQLNDAPLVPARNDFRTHWDNSLALLEWARSGWLTLGPRDFIRLTRQSAQAFQPNVIGETLTRRLLPGQGEQPVRELVSTLRANGCQAPLGVEVFSSKLRRLSAREAATRAMRSCRHVVEIAPNPVSSG